MQSLQVLYVRASSHYDLGKATGSSFKQLIHEYRQTAKSISSLQKFYNSKSGKEIYDQYLETSSKCFPEIIRELEGIADGAELSFTEIFLQQLLSEVLLVHEGELSDVSSNADHDIARCSDVLVNSKAFRMIAHNEDWEKEARGFEYFINATVESADNNGKVLEEFASFVIPGELPGLTFGMNKDLVLTVNTLLPKHVNRKSVPLALVLRKLLTCKSIDECVAVMENKPYGCAYGINVNIASIHGKDMCTLEVYPEKDGTTSTHVMPLTSDVDDYFYHFNHYAHTEGTQEMEYVTESRRREARAKQLKSPRTDADVRRILGDTDDKYRNCEVMDARLGVLLFSLMISPGWTFPTHHLNKRVVNGRTIKRGEWPFLVSLHYLKSFPFTENSKMKHLCGGALINKRWVLTAAHCIGFFDELAKPKNWEVVVGEYNQYLKDETEQVIRPESFFIHPSFNPHYTSTLENDIALIKLSQDALLGPNVGLASLDNRTDFDVNTRCQIGGWGQVSKEPYGWGMYIPLKSTLYKFDNNECKEIYDTINDDGSTLKLKIDESVMCAGIPQERQSEIQRLEGGVSDACSGDSGSPIICETDFEGEYKMAGIVSAGKDCGSSLYPGIYTKVSFYQNWIQDTIQLNDNEIM